MQLVLNILLVFILINAVLKFSFWKLWQVAAAVVLSVVSFLGLSVCNGTVAGNDTKRPRNPLYPKQYRGAGNHRSCPLSCLLFLRTERTFLRREKPMEHLPKSLPCPADVPCFVLSPYAKLFLLFRNGFFHHYHAVFGRFGAVHHRWSVVHPSVFP